MKKKVFLAIIAVLVICLTCGMLLVACNNKDDNGGGGGKDPGKNPGGVVPPVTAIDIMQDIIDDFDEVAKDTDGDKEFNFGLEILDGEKPVFAIATETIGGNDYLYGAVGNNMKKFNGLDLGGVVETVLSWLGTDIKGVVNLDADKFLDGMVGLVLPGILGSYEVAENGEAYRMEVALSGVISLIDGSEESLVDINELIGDAAGTVNGIIDTVCGLLGITNEEIGIASDATVTLGNFLTYISKFTVNAYFGFGANADKAQEATNATANPFGNLAFGERVKAAREATDAINILNFEGQVKIETLDEKNNNVKHTYLLDIGVDVNPFVLLKDKNGGCGLLSLLKLKDETKDLLDGGKLVFENFEIADILEMLDGFGYIHIAMNEVTISGEGEAQTVTPVKNLFTLHYDSEEDAAIVAAALVDAIDGKHYAIGGSYNVSALADIINEIIAQAKKDKEDNAGENAGGAAVATAEHTHADANGDCVCDVEGCGAAMHVDSNNDCKCDKCKAPMHVDTNPADGVCDRCKAVSNAMTFIGTLFGELTKKDQDYYAIDKENGTITVDTDNIADYLVKLLMKDPTGQGAQVKGIIPQILGGNALRLSVSEKFAYAPEGGIERVEEEDIMYNLREDFAGDTMNKFMETITSVTAKDGGEIVPGSLVTVTGTAFDGTTRITATGIVMQTTDDTYYIGIVTDMYQNLDALKALVNSIIPNAWTDDFKLEANWPFYGVLAYPVPAQA